MDYQEVKIYNTSKADGDLVVIKNDVEVARLGPRTSMNIEVKEGDVLFVLKLGAKKPA